MAEPRNRRAMTAPCRRAAPGGIAARARAAAGAPYLDDLNPEQRQAVETLDGPVLVLAGAGTGKTRVLTTRIAHILATGRARPSEILAVTFTNKAAREMKQRVGAMVGQIVEGMPWLGTFHSIGVKILRRHAELVGPQARLHHPRRRRPDPAAQAAARGREHRREALAGARARRPDRRLEEPRPHARPGAGRRSRELRRRQGQEALRRLSGAAEDAQRRRLRRPAARMHPAVPRAARRAAAVPGALPLHPGRRISGHQRRAVSLAAAAGAEHRLLVMREGSAKKTMGHGFGFGGR